MVFRFMINIIPTRTQAIVKAICRFENFINPSYQFLGVSFRKRGPISFSIYRFTVHTTSGPYSTNTTNSFVCKKKKQKTKNEKIFVGIHGAAGDRYRE